ncbi:PAS domain S-box protein [Bacillus sp. BRMEA1]|uniref:PAS domain S-box protein n=1 Tax=Neobacillus endophyticus TaxID=2738405 RepID=UPI001563B991|nr:PAS domain S-box protein [Neobacillus endophyticus]NRD76801.1 PAS domain S-box protein [Neobacillus endophyticus]
MNSFDHSIYLLSAVNSDRMGMVIFITFLAILFVSLAGYYFVKKIASREVNWEKSRYQSLFIHNPDGMVTMDRNGTILSVNPSGETITGYSKEELLKKEFVSLLEPEERKKMSGYIQLVLQGQTHVVETAFINKNGTFRDFQIKLIPTIKNDEIFGLYGIIKDITEFKDAEKALKDSEERYKRLVELSPAAIMVHHNGLIQFVNPAFIQLIGAKDQSELIGRPVIDFISDDYVDMVKNRMETLKQPEAFGAPMEEKAVRLDGEIIDVEVTGISLPYGDQTSVLVIAYDISLRKHVEKALKESEYKYRLIAENMRDLIVVAGEDRRIKYASLSYKAVLDISPEEYVGQYSYYLVHPDDIGSLKNTVDLVKEDKTPKKVVLRKRNITTGQYLFFETDILPIFDKNGEIKELLAISRDMTDRYLAEQALKASEEKYRLITEYSQDMIRLIDENGLAIYASPSHKTILGYAPEEFVGRHIAAGIHPDDVEPFQTKLALAIKEHENFRVEVRRQHKAGHWIWVESHGTLVTDEEGHLKQIVLTSRNIMDRKEYEERLKNLAFCDPLTGLPNRRSFSHLLERSIKEAERYGRMLAVLFLDLDNFKWVNDTFGHDVGDVLLMQFAQRLQSVLRESDVIARLGGDEFIILLPEISTEQDAVAAAEKILDILREPWNVEGQTLHTTSSIGIAIYPENGTASQQLIKRADLALYHAKEQGRNTYHKYV